MKEFENIVKAYFEAKAGNLSSALLSIVGTEGSSYRKAGARMLVDAKGKLSGAISGGCLEGDAMLKAAKVINRQKSLVIKYETGDSDENEIIYKLGCSGTIWVLIEPMTDRLAALIGIMMKSRVPMVLVSRYERLGWSVNAGTFYLYINEFKEGDISPELSQLSLMCLEMKKSNLIVIDGCNYFFHFVAPCLRLLIVGGGFDVPPIVRMAKQMGWQTQVVYHKACSHVMDTKFTLVDIRKLLPKVILDPYTAILVMTHNYDIDKAALRLWGRSNVFYIGLLGPEKKKFKIVEELKSESIYINKDLIDCPMGLKIGADGAEEIALSIVGLLIKKMKN